MPPRPGSPARRFTVTTRMIQTEIAVLRFGLGARPGDLAAAAGDPRAWLMAQIKGAVPLAGNTPLAASDQIFTELLAARDEYQQMKREAAAPSMPVFSPSYPRGPFRFIRREYLIVTYETEPDAIAVERQIKGWSRIKGGPDPRRLRVTAAFGKEEWLALCLLPILRDAPCGRSSG